MTAIATSELMRQVTDQASRADPYPIFASFREKRIRKLADDSYVLARYDDVVSLLHDPRISSDPHNRTDVGGAIVVDHGPFIQRDPPDHDRLRAVATRFFGPPARPGLVSGMEPEIAVVVDRMIDALPVPEPGGTAEADLVDQFAYPLPVSVICGLLGVPEQDQQQFHAWTEDIVAGLDADDQEAGDELIQRRDQAQAGMLGFVSDLIGRHREQPDGSMLSGLANDDAPDAMTLAELVGTSFMLLIAGHETTVNLTANGVLTLLRNPWAIDRLRADPGWVVPLVEELLRFEPPVQYLPNRTALTDIELDGATIPKGAQVLLLLAAANRDASRISRADEFDPDRIASGDAPHVGFGSGLHYCFGAPLARIEAQVSLLAFARRFVNPRLAADPPPYRPSPVLRGPVHLPVRYDGLRPGS